MEVSLRFLPFSFLTGDNIIMVHCSKVLSIIRNAGSEGVEENKRREKQEQNGRKKFLSNRLGMNEEVMDILTIYEAV